MSTARSVGAALIVCRMAAARAWARQAAEAGEKRAAIPCPVTETLRVAAL
jgi:hypothetical protein